MLGWTSLLIVIPAGDLGGLHGPVASGPISPVKVPWRCRRGAQGAVRPGGDRRGELPPTTGRAQADVL